MPQGSMFSPVKIQDISHSSFGYIEVFASYACRFYFLATKPVKNKLFPEWFIRFHTGFMG